MTGSEIPGTPPGIIEYLTLALAIWGAGLSTIIGLFEIRKQDRRLVIGNMVARRAQENVTFRVTNVSLRPITIVLVDIDRLMVVQGKKYWVGINEIMDPSEIAEASLPLTLSDGEPFTFNLGGIRDILVDDEKVLKVRVTISDVEGRTYKKVTEWYRPQKNKLGAG
jgi:hypothetical protein